MDTLEQDNILSIEMSSIQYRGHCSVSIFIEDSLNSVSIMRGSDDISIA